MPFIGQQPLTGAYSKLDSITTSATATYNLQLGGSAYSPASANHLLVSLNGVMQAPQDSFTVSGSTITFASALTSSDNIDFIMAMGDVLNIGTPSDGTVTSGKIASGAVTSAKLDTNIAISGNLTTGNITTGNTSIVTGGRFISSQTSNDPWLKGVNSSNTETSYIKKDGQIYSAFGISLGGTGAANTLDDYEEGTWTPSTNIGFNSITDASYVKIGKLVFVNLSAQTNTGPGDVSQATSVSGLPFACRTGNAVSNSVIIEGLNQDVYAEISGNSYSQVDKDNGTAITRGEFGQQRNCRVTLVYSIA